MSINTQEYFGWVGNSIFITAALAQLIHSIKTKKTSDLSYIMIVMMIIGNSAYTGFGLADNSISLTVGSSGSVFIYVIQLGFKIHYENCYKNREELQPLMPNEYESDMAVSINE
jgi:uncharacterized protein with PQ loop repeat